MTSRGLLAAGVAIAIALPLLGCTKGPGQRVQENIATFTREQTPDKLVESGKAFAAVGDLTRAEEYFSKALDAGGDEAAIMPLLLTVCIQDARYRVAIQYAEQYIRKHPSDVRTRFVLGSLYAAVGEGGLAKTELLRVVEQRPAEAKAHFALAVVMRDSESDLVGADLHFREYLRLEPKGSHAEEARASLLKSTRDAPPASAPATEHPVRVPETTEVTAPLPTPLPPRGPK